MHLGIGGGASWARIALPAPTYYKDVTKFKLTQYSYALSLADLHGRVPNMYRRSTE